MKKISGILEILKLKKVTRYQKYHGDTLPTGQARVRYLKSIGLNIFRPGTHFEYFFAALIFLQTNFEPILTRAFESLLNIFRLLNSDQYLSGDGRWGREYPYSHQISSPRGRLILNPLKLRVREMKR